MRLLNTRTLEVENFGSKKAPPYAILSHTWEDEEVTFQDMEKKAAETKAGYTKIRNSCRQALRDGLDYVWIDTCCIDKTSSTELSEAINAMFKWYRNSAVCYAFLSDVPNDTTVDVDSPFSKSRWFTRGWTLQELLAPKSLEFYSASWAHLGSKSLLSVSISSVTGIDEHFLRGRSLFQASIAARMSWASRRETSREEDRSYSLLGLFNVHIALLYGEGGKSAFLRLQEELIRKTDDQSIFAWHSSVLEEATVAWEGEAESRSPSVLAESPSDFQNCGEIVICNPIEGTLTYVLSNVGIQMDLPIFFRYEGTPARRRAYAILCCRFRTDYWSIMSLPVLLEGDRCGRAFPAIHLIARSQSMFRSFRYTLQLETRQERHWASATNNLHGRRTSVLVLRSLPTGYRVESVSPPESWESWSPTSGRLTQWQVGGEKQTMLIMKISGDDPVNVPIRKLRIVMRTIFSSDDATPQHHVQLFGHVVPHLQSQVSTLLSDWQRIALEPETGEQLGQLLVRTTINPAADFQHDTGVIDISMRPAGEISLFQRLKIQLQFCWEVVNVAYILSIRPIALIMWSMSLLGLYGCCLGISDESPSTGPENSEAMNGRFIGLFMNSLISLIYSRLICLIFMAIAYCFPSAQHCRKFLAFIPQSYWYSYVLAWPFGELVNLTIMESGNQQSVIILFLVQFQFELGGSWEPFQRILHKWAFPLFRLTIWLEDAAKGRYFTYRKMKDSTLGQEV